MSFTGGYPFRDGSTVELDVGSESFTLGPGQRRRRRMGLDRPVRRQPRGGGDAQRRERQADRHLGARHRRPWTPSRCRASPPPSRTPRPAAAERARSGKSRPERLCEGGVRLAARPEPGCPMTAVSDHAGVADPAAPRRRSGAAEPRRDDRATALRAALVEAGTPEAQAAMRVEQIWQWIYHRGARDFAAMTNLARDYRAHAGRALRHRPPGGRRPARSRPTAPASTCCASPAATRSRPSTSPRPTAARSACRRQVGCTLTCSFCHTGTQRLVRNLTAAEIVGQILVARDDLGDWGRAPAGEAAGLQHRADGHGRAALQLRRGARRDEDRHGRRGHRAVAPAHHPLDLGRRARRSPGSATRSAACSPSRSTPPPTRSATRWCRSTANGTSPRCSTPAAPIRGCRTPSGSPSST